jgi:hypothetical protein
VTPTRRSNRARIFRLSWSLLLFLLGFFALLVLITHQYLLPALQIIPNATTSEKRWLSVASALLLAVVLFVLGAGLVMIFRVGRFFSRSSDARTTTKYVDAWAESGRRVSMQPTDDADEQE